MIGILSNNRLDEDFLEKLDVEYSLIEDYENETLDFDGLYIDWLPKIPVYENEWIKQASLLRNHIKLGIPIVIFDREVSLTKKEIDWCTKFNTHLFEPVLNSGRTGFSYLPEWIQSFEIAIDNEDREFDIAYSYHQLEYQIKGFEKWIKDYARLFPDKKVAYGTHKISDFKKEEYKNDNLNHFDGHPVFDQGFFTVALDVDKAYKMGYMNKVYFFAMTLGCLPLLPVEHKYFHSMFKGLVVNDLKEMDYFVSLYGKVKNVIIEEIFDRIKSEWSEFTVEHATDRIRSCYE